VQSADPDQQLEQLTTTGPYSGVLEAFTTGVKLFTRYSRLRALAGRNLTYVWASDSNRVIDTARHFSAGFFGLDDNNTKLFVVSEAEDNGGDTLTPGYGTINHQLLNVSVDGDYIYSNTCKKYVHDIEKGHQYGYEMLYKYRATYLGTVSERLGVENPGFGFTGRDALLLYTIISMLKSNH
jgi:acid phosphatase